MISQSRPSESPLLALHRATHATLHQLAADLADLELPASEMNALANLADGRSRTVSELGAALGTRPTTLTSVLDRLEGRGYVTRGGRRGDRRVVVIKLTPPGKDVAARIRRAFAVLERHALRDLPPEAIEGFHTVLRALSGRPGDGPPAQR